jgi:transposase-like protein
MSEFKIKLSNIKEKFEDEVAAHEYLGAWRWKDGEVSCPHCGNIEYYCFSDHIRYKCKSCKLIFTAKTNTFMEASKLPSYKWIYGMYLLMQKKGISSVQLAEILEIQQRSAWFMLQRLRYALGNDKEDDKLEGVVSADAAAIGGKNKNRHHDKKYKYEKGRGYPDKTTVFGIGQKDGNIKTFVVKNESHKEIKPIIYQNVKQGSVLVTDEFKTYNTFKNNYEHVICNHARGQYAKDGYSSNNIENFWSHLKRGLSGIYIQVSRKHLQKYLFEFQFRHNNRNLDIPTKIGLILDRMECRLKYKELIA